MPYPDKRKIVCVGDLHQCIDEFYLLLDQIKYDPKTIRLISLGDISNRGPNKNAIEIIRKMSIEVCLSNHEMWYLRFEELENQLGKKNPMRNNKRRADQYDQFSKDDLTWIKSLPSKIHLKDNWYALHAGAEVATSFLDQSTSTLIRCRWIDNKTGLMVENKDKEQPKNSSYWATVWNQPYNIVFGHHGFMEPTIFKNDNNVCVGIDTRCVFGGSLTAYNLDDNKFTSVKAKRKYY